jgi:uncharacterized protein YbaR (Trm112 family)
MPPDPTALPLFDLSVVNQLACPACLGALRFAEDRLLCAACGRAYPIVDGIPALIAEKAEQSSQ